MRISYSQCATYQNCPHQYRLQYLDRIPVPLTADLHFGSAVHEALKFMYDPRHLQPPSLEEVAATFAAAWKARQPEIPQEQYQGYLEQGLLMLQRHYQRHHERAPGRYTATTEQFFSIPFDEQHTLVGRIDRVDVLPENRLEVIDYKTSRRMPPQTVMAKNVQLAIYRMAADALYPGREVTTTLLYVFHDYEMRLEQSAEFLAEKQEEIRDIIAGIQLGDFDPRPGGHCDWCGYQAHCQLYRAPTVPEELAEVDIGALLKEYADLYGQEKAAEKRLSLLKERICQYLDACATERVEGGGYVAARRRSRRVSGWDEARLRELLAPLGLWDRVTQVSSGAVRALLQSRELPRELKRVMESTATYSEVQQLRVRAITSAEDEEGEE
jgi:RecB family exonuclease